MLPADSVPAVQYGSNTETGDLHLVPERSNNIREIREDHQNFYVVDQHAARLEWPNEYHAQNGFYIPAS